MTEYVPLLISLANEKGLSEEEKRMVVTLELAGQDNQFYGVEYVAREWDMADEDAETKAKKFIEDVVYGDETYREMYEEFAQEYAETIEEKLDQYDS